MSVYRPREIKGVRFVPLQDFRQRLLWRVEMGTLSTTLEPVWAYLLMKLLTEKAA